MSISQQYAELNRQLHAQHPEYGTGGALNAPAVAKLAKANGFKTILDFGCGKGTLKSAMAKLAPDIEVSEYDPAVLGKDVLPTAIFDLVVALDVMEHIEPEHLTETLATIRSLTGKCTILNIAIREAQKILPDGRNAHLIVQPEEWWLEKLAPYFTQSRIFRAEGQFTFIGAPK
jgi:2-polyprenyl-3-methyl-5-hydroxy-6-metoxy-1,4-benzoquinol methylase